MTNHSPTWYFLRLLVFVMLMSMSQQPSWGFAPETNVYGYLEKNWTRESGLPQNTILSLVQDQYGFIWIGTPAGLVRFDGYQFKTYNQQNTPALKNDFINTLHIDRENRLWIGTEGGGVYYLQDGIWSSITTQDGLSHDYVRTIISDSRGNIWIGTDYGLNCISPHRIEIYTTHEGLTDNIITSLATDNQGSLWIGTYRGGLMQFINGMVSHYGRQHNLTSTSILSLHCDQRNQLWVGTRQGLFYLPAKQARFHYFTKTGDTPITTLGENPQGTLWVGTMTDGLWRIREGELTGQGGGDQYIRTLLFDNQDILWIGSDASGLFQWQDRKIHNITREHGLPSGIVNTILQNRGGDIWIGMMDGGLLRLRKNRIISSITKKYGLTDNQITSLCEDNQGNLWIGTTGGGLNILNGNALKRISLEDGLLSNTITCILEDEPGNIWIGTDRGLNRLEESWNFRTISTALITQHIRTLRKGKAGKLLIGTKTGFFTYAGNQFDTTLFHPTLKRLDILAVHQDTQDRIWLGTNGNGLYCLHGKDLSYWTTREGLPENSIFSIIEDQAGNFWMSSYGGVFKISPEALFKVSRGDVAFLIYDLYDENEGMVSSRCSAAGKPAALKTSAGHIYYATAAGIAIFETKQLIRSAYPLPLHIESILADGHRLNPEKEVILPYPVNNLNITFSSPNYISPGKTRFYHKLENHDSSWIQLTPPLLTNISYMDLMPGHYKLYLKAIGNGGRARQAEMEFYIVAPFYHSALFWLSLIAVLLGSAGFIFYALKRGTIHRQVEKYKTSPLDPQKVEEVVPLLLKLMTEEKIYLNPNLNLKTAAKQVRIHPNYLSRIINERFEMNFNDFINHYRIEEAKGMLQKTDGNERNILEIMYDCGFYSKSVFNTAFKKFSGTTPSEYKKTHLNSSHQ
jgi:ligand-binding sensor domain-containing protein/AraC-like DNA-binding protein